jgi:radical SAM superfamily enzyme with C-terminal helix-hairpin-helix motif
MKATQKEVMVVPVQVRKQIEMAMLKMMIPQGIKEIIFKNSKLLFIR